MFMTLCHTLIGYLISFIYISLNCVFLREEAELPTRPPPPRQNPHSLSNSITCDPVGFYISVVDPFNFTKRIRKRIQEAILRISHSIKRNNFFKASNRSLCIYPHSTEWLTVWIICPHNAPTNLTKLEKSYSGQTLKRFQAASHLANGPWGQQPENSLEE